MADGVAARRYAQAIFDIAQERGDIDRWLDDLRLASEVLGEPSVLGFMSNPDVAFGQKQRILMKSLGSLNPLALNVVYLLIQRSRLQTLSDILSEFETLVNELRGIEIAEITTAVPLSDQEAVAVARRLEALTGKRIVLQQSVDEAIIGGMIARVGDKLIDGSVRGKLTALRERLN